jgi:rhodanese-related sulfurtransferase
MGEEMNPTSATQPQELSLAEYLTRWQSQPIQVIDVRERDEWYSGHMPEATLVPLSELEQRRNELDPARPVVIVCRSGRRSLVAARYLAHSGFAAARSLAGGMIAWAAAGQPVER